MKKIILAFIVCFFVSIAFGQDNSPLTMDGIIQLKKSGVSDAEIIASIEKLKVDFFLDRQAERTLIKNYISDEIINSVIKNSPEGLFVTNVSNRDTITHFDIQLKGSSTIYEGRYLWFFSHKKELPDMWWPQYNVVHVDPKTRRFSTMVFLGESKDINDWFEIKGMWVDQADHERILKYYDEQNESQSSTWPPLSIPFGEPEIVINLYKAEH